ncbi:hypothetical protein KGP36_02390 [Patescibacteria group bacterium]|nr:hypothetical protein [Patescibacteria group bacterium]
MGERVIPETLGACADALYKAREERYALQKKVTEIEEYESALKEKLIRELPKGEASGVAGRVARVSVEGKPVPRVEDWDALLEHVRKTRGFDLLQRRVNDAAVRERWDDRKTVPGVAVFNATVVKINKL